MPHEQERNTTFDNTSGRAVGVTVRGVQKMIEEGRLKALKIGRDYVISLGALNGITRQPAGRPPKAKTEDALPTNDATARTITNAAKKVREK